MRWMSMIGMDVKARGCGRTASAISPARQVLFDCLIYLSHRLHGYNLIRSASGFMRIKLKKMCMERVVNL